MEDKALEQSQALELSMKIETFLNTLRQSAKNLSVLERQKVIRLVIKEIIVGLDEITIKHSIPITGTAEPGAKEKESYQLYSSRKGTKKEEKNFCP